MESEVSLPSLQDPVTERVPTRLNSVHILKFYFLNILILNSHEVLFLPSAFNISAKKYLRLEVPE
jgi:hypothetical protein